MATNVKDKSIAADERSSGIGTGPPGYVASGSLSVHDSFSEPSQTGIWVALAAITMMFAAFTSALFVRQGTAFDWLHITLPRVMYFNTLVLLLSSVALELSRSRIKDYLRGASRVRAIPLRWLSTALVMGVTFVVGQVIAWQDLKARGLYLATSPASSFFYVLTMMHGLHVLGGIGGLIRLISKLAGDVPSLSRSTFSATACYWHFMGLLWIYLLVIIRTQL